LRLNDDDSSKKADAIFKEDGVDKGVQITRLLFTRYEERKALASSKSLDLAKRIANLIKLPLPVVVNIFPATKKDVVPLSDANRGRLKIETELVQHIASCLHSEIRNLLFSDSPIWLTIENPKLSKHFRRIVLNPVPRGAFPKFPGVSNIYVNYDFNEVSFEQSDVDHAIEEIYRKKNHGLADFLAPLLVFLRALNAVAAPTTEVLAKIVR